MINGKQMLYRRDRFAPRGLERTGSLIFDRELARATRDDAHGSQMKIWTNGHFRPA